MTMERAVPMVQPHVRSLAPELEAESADGAQGEIRFGLVVAALFFVLFLGWAAFVPLSAAAYAPGKLIVSGQRQTIQHREGGVVSEVLIREGQRVKAGQVLVRLAGADVQAQERALTAQFIALAARRARLQAETFGQPRITPPAEFATLSPADKKDAEVALRLQSSELAARRSLLSAQRSVIRQRTQQATSQGSGYGSQLESTTEQIRLINEELESLRTVADKGFVSKNRIRALERARAELEGQRGQYLATRNSSSEAAGESRFQAIEAERSFAERVALELREVDTALNDLRPRLSAARDQLARTEIRAPASGTVVGLSIFSPGAVVSPGQKVLDIVPERSALVIEALISPDDADDLRVGQKTRVRFATLHDRSLPDLEAELTHLSADSFVDEKTGQSFFKGEVTVPHSSLRQIENRIGRNALRPGIPVEVLIPLRERTALQYAFEPLTESFWGSFREQ
jgi:HlyD family secretion protein